MKDARHDLHAINQARTRAAEEGVAIDHPGVGSERIEAAACRLDLAQAAVERKTARHDYHDLGIGVDHLLPSDRMRRLSRHAKPLVAARCRDELRCPVTAVKWRVDPLEAHHRSPAAIGDALLDRRDSLAKGIADFLRGIMPADQAADEQDVLEDVLETLRLERNELG